MFGMNCSTVLNDCLVVLLFSFLDMSEQETFSIETRQDLSSPDLHRNATSRVCVPPYHGCKRLVSFLPQMTDFSPADYLVVLGGSNHRQEMGSKMSLSPSLVQKLDCTYLRPTMNRQVLRKVESQGAKSADKMVFQKKLL